MAFLPQNGFLGKILNFFFAGRFWVLSSITCRIHFSKFKILAHTHAKHRDSLIRAWWRHHQILPEVGVQSLASGQKSSIDTFNYHQTKNWRLFKKCTIRVIFDTLALAYIFFIEFHRFIQKEHFKEKCY